MTSSLLASTWVGKDVAKQVGRCPFGRILNPKRVQFEMPKWISAAAAHVLVLVAFLSSQIVGILGGLSLRLVLGSGSLSFVCSTVSAINISAAGPCVYYEHDEGIRVRARTRPSKPRFHWARDNSKRGDLPFRAHYHVSRLRRPDETLRVR